MRKKGSLNAKITFLFLLFSSSVLAIQDSTSYYSALYRVSAKPESKDIDASIRKLDDCIRFFDIRNDSVFLSKSLIAAAALKQVKGRFSESFKYLWRSLLIVEQLDDIRLRHQTHKQLATLYNIFDKNAEAFFHESEVLRLTKLGVEKQIFKETTLISAYYSFVHYYRKTEDYHRALLYLDSCNSLSDKLNRTQDDRAYLISEKGNILQHLGYVDKAIAIFKESETRFKQLNPSYLTIIYYYLGQAYQRTSQSQAAENSYRKALVVIDSFPKHFDAKFEIQYLLSKVLQEQGRYREAYDYLYQSQQLSEHFFSAKGQQNQDLFAIRNLYEERIQKKDATILKKNVLLHQQEQKTMRFRVGLIFSLSALLISILVGYLYLQRKRFSSKQQQQQLAVQLREEQNKTLLESKNKELTAFTLQLIDKDSLVNKLVAATQAHAPENEALQTIVKQNVSGQLDLWDEFNKRFVEVNTSFYEKLKEKYPELSPTELKHCALIKLNFSAKEMAQLLNISLNGVNTSRYRIRKKMQLDRDVNLGALIGGI